MNTPLLRIENVTLRYDEKVVLSRTSLTVMPHTMLLLHGPNGGGKTTLLRLMAGLLRPTEGRVVRTDGLTIGYLPQYRDIDRRFPITVGEVVLSGLEGEKPLWRNFTPQQRQRATDALRRFELSPIADKLIDALSGGQWQRTLLARAWVSRPQLLLLDEPDTHLDAENKQMLYHLLKEEVSERAIVMVSHDASVWNNDFPDAQRMEIDP